MTMAQIAQIFYESGKSPADLDQFNLNPSQRAWVGALILVMHRTKKSGVTQAEIGHLVGVSQAYISMAKQLYNSNTVDLMAPVEQGVLSLNDAIELLPLPPDQRKERMTNLTPLKKPSTSVLFKEKPAKVKPTEKPAEKTPLQSLGVGVRYANEAINSLIRIPKDDGLRKRGFQIVSDWIKNNS